MAELGVARPRSVRRGAARRRRPLSGAIRPARALERSRAEHLPGNRANPLPVSLGGPALDHYAAQVLAHDNVVHLQQLGSARFDADVLQDRREALAELVE